MKTVMDYDLKVDQTLCLTYTGCAVEYNEFCSAAIIARSFGINYIDRSHSIERNKSGQKSV